MSNFNTTPLDNETIVSLHTGNPDLLSVEDAQALRVARERTLADKALEHTPRDIIDRLSIILSAARKHELETTIQSDVAA